MFRKTLVFIIYILLPCIALCEPMPVVNVLSWWGYLDRPWVSKMVTDTCHAKLSYDSFETNTEMFKIFKNNPNRYDVLIFSYTDYNQVKNQIAKNNSNLYKISDDYEPTIRKQYQSLHLPHNISLFMLSLTGFIWNPKIISLNNQDSVTSIFNKAGKNIVTLMDDPTEINMLFMRSQNIEQNNSNYIFSFSTLKNLVGQANVLISNNPEQAYTHDNFAMAYQWSGIALAEMKSHPTYKFLINKNLTYVSADMVAQLSNTKPTACVARLFSSKDFLQSLQIEAYYFSPYADDSNVPPGDFKTMYKLFIQVLPDLQWIIPLPNQQLDSITQKWAMIKYYINSKQK